MTDDPRGRCERCGGDPIDDPPRRTVTFEEVGQGIDEEFGLCHGCFQELLHDTMGDGE